MGIGNVEQKTNPNHVAFPQHPNRSRDSGLTKREYFAAMAMQGIMSYPRMQQTNEKEAAFCVAMADALIEALNK